MKTSSKILIVFGIIIVITGMLVFRDLHYVNAVDAHPWTININGINSFPWITFSGGVLIVIGIIFYIASLGNTRKRYN
jgi:hypothetical protein